MKSHHDTDNNNVATSNTSSNATSKSWTEESFIPVQGIESSALSNIEISPGFGISGAHMGVGQTPLSLSNGDDDIISPYALIQLANQSLPSIIEEGQEGVCNKYIYALLNMTAFCYEYPGVLHNDKDLIARSRKRFQDGRLNLVCWHCLVTKKLDEPNSVVSPESVKHIPRNIQKLLTHFETCKNLTGDERTKWNVSKNTKPLRATGTHRIIISNAQDLGFYDREGGGVGYDATKAKSTEKSSFWSDDECESESTHNMNLGDDSLFERDLYDLSPNDVKGGL